MAPEDYPAEDAPSRGAIAAAAAGAFVLTFAFRWVTIAFPNDHFTHLTRARQIVSGEWPIRDFFDPGQFLHYYLSAAMQVVFGYNLFGEALLTVGFMALAAAVVCGLGARLSGSIGVGAGAAMLSVMSYPRLYNYPKVIIYPVALWLVWWYAQRPSRGRLALLAVWSIISFLFRFDHGAYVVATMAVLLVLVHVDRPRRWFAETAVFGVLCAVLLVPFAIYVEWAQGIVKYVQEEVDAARLVGRDMTDVPPVRLATSQPPSAAQNRPPASPPAASPTPPPAGSPTPPPAAGANATVPPPRPRQNPPPSTLTLLVRRLTTAVPAIRPGPGFSSPQNALFWFYYVVVLLPYVAMALCVGAWWLGRIDRREAAAIGAAAFMCFVIDRTLVRANPWARLADVAAPLAVLGAWVAGRWLTVPSGGTFRLGGQTFRRIVFAVFSVITFWSVGLQAELPAVFRSAHLLEGPPAIRVEFADVTRGLWLRPVDFWSPPDQRTGLRALVRYVLRCTEPTDRLVVTGAFAPDAAFYAERLFGGGQVHFLGGWHNSLKEQGITIERLRSQSIPVVLEFQNGIMQRMFPHVQRYFEHYYHEVPLPPFASDNEPWHLLVENSRTPLGTDPLLGVPCYRNPPGDE